MKLPLTLILFSFFISCSQQKTSIQNNPGDIPFFKNYKEYLEIVPEIGRLQPKVNLNSIDILAQVHINNNCFYLHDLKVDSSKNTVSIIPIYRQKKDLSIECSDFERQTQLTKLHTLEKKNNTIKTIKVLSKKGWIYQQVNSRL